ncbi:MAG: hypothetical protein HY507_01435 [Candidatus Zambryskibacteria bacterium]|nr:hypothetical protein [Candidatus Zambryskibacteria bacterium]
MKSITFTNNLSVDIMQWIEKYSASQKVTRRAVLEKALTEFRKSVRRKEYSDSFRRARLDADIKQMSENGLGDYLRHLSYLEK